MLVVEMCAHDGALSLVLTERMAHIRRQPLRSSTSTQRNCRNAGLELAHLPVNQEKPWTWIFRWNHLIWSICLNFYKTHCVGQAKHIVRMCSAIDTEKVFNLCLFMSLLEVKCQYEKGPWYFWRYPPNEELCLKQLLVKGFTDKVGT